MPALRADRNYRRERCGCSDPTFGRRGRLISQIINGEEWSPYYYLRDGSGPDPKFQALDTPLLASRAYRLLARLMTLFAIGR